MLLFNDVANRLFTNRLQLAVVRPLSSLGALSKSEYALVELIRPPLNIPIAGGILLSLGMSRVCFYLASAIALQGKEMFHSSAFNR